MHKNGERPSKFVFVCVKKISINQKIFLFLLSLFRDSLHADWAPRVKPDWGSWRENGFFFLFFDLFGFVLF